MPRYVDPGDEEDDLEEELESEGEGPTFERIRKSTGKTPTIKDDRRQQGKEWGRMHNKFHKQRKKMGEREKP